MHFRQLLLAVTLAVAGGAHAQSPSGPPLPRPAEFYFEADAKATKPIIAVRETGEAATAKLLKLLERNPRAKAENAHLAHLAMVAGRNDLGREFYLRSVLLIPPTDGVLWRPLMWNYGWDLYRAGDTAGALEQWKVLLEARGLTASWMPPTLAVALWSLGRKDEAVQWYAAAVRTEPQQWSGISRYPALLPEWRDAERATLAEVQAAWAANPPSWP
jgi:tetratricopeptide (TPR) repeat protein